MGTKHTNKASELADGSVLVEFGPDVVRGFHRVEEAFKQSGVFDAYERRTIEIYTENQPTTLSNAMLAISHTAYLIMEHMQKTGDTKPMEAFQDIMNAFSALQKRDIPALKLFKGPKGRSQSSN